MGRFLDAIDDYRDVNNIIRITGDDILVDPDYLDDMMFFHLHTESDFTYTTYLPKGFEVEIIKHSVFRDIYNNLPDTSDTEHMGEYFRKLGNKLDYKPRNPAHCRPDLSFELDTKEDKERLEVIFRRLSLRYPHYPLDEVIDLADHLHLSD
jgi:spore coat polysaccharide biosynthesis protein SpsF (cytidylyltransferase family)